MTQIRRFSTIFIWIGLTVYSLLTILFTDFVMVDSHYINLALVLATTVAFLFGQPTGQLTTIIMLVIGFLGRGAPFVSVYYFKMFGLTVYWPYLLLILLFSAINYQEIPDWYATAFNDKQTDSNADKEKSV